MYKSLGCERSPTIGPVPKSSGLASGGVTLIHVPSGQVLAAMHGSGGSGPASADPPAPALPPPPPPASPPVPAPPVPPDPPPGETESDEQCMLAPRSAHPRRDRT